ncbi:MAG: hypothetical protein SGI77_08245 [Pirellulaceae bacterium]|nr:hypothetical protein [Pirellulaceae bacterium]
MMKQATKNAQTTLSVNPYGMPKEGNLSQGAIKTNAHAYNPSFISGANENCEAADVFCRMDLLRLLL